MSGLAKRTYHVGYHVTSLQLAESVGGETYTLHYKSDGAALDVRVSDGKRNTLALLSYTDDYEVTGTA